MVPTFLPSSYWNSLLTMTLCVCALRHLDKIAHQRSPNHPRPLVSHRSRHKTMTTVSQRSFDFLTRYHFLDCLWDFPYTWHELVHDKLCCIVFVGLQSAWKKTPGFQPRQPSISVPNRIHHCSSSRGDIRVWIRAPWQLQFGLLLRSNRSQRFPRPLSVHRQSSHSNGDTPSLATSLRSQTTIRSNAKNVTGVDEEPQKPRAKLDMFVQSKRNTSSCHGFLKRQGSIRQCAVRRKWKQVRRPVIGWEFVKPRSFRRSRSKRT